MKSIKKKILVSLIASALIVESFFIPHIHVNAAVKDTNSYCTDFGEGQSKIYYYKAEKDEHGNYHRVGEGKLVKEIEVVADEKFFLVYECPYEGATVKWTTDLLVGYGWADKPDGRLYMVAWDMPGGHHYCIYLMATVGDVTYVNTLHVYTVCEHDYKTKLTPATCTADGVLNYSCDTCGYNANFPYARKTPHNFTTTVFQEMTCTTSRGTKTVCPDCGLIRDINYEPAPGHNYVEEVTPLTCTQNGMTVLRCTACGNTRTTSVEQHPGHDPINKSVE